MAYDEPHCLDLCCLPSSLCTFGSRGNYFPTQECKHWNPCFSETAQNSANMINITSVINVTLQHFILKIKRDLIDILAGEMNCE